MHPVHHRDLYGVIEEIIVKAIPLWNDVLIKDSGYHQLSGRTPPRIQTLGHESEPASEPEWARKMRSNREDPAYSDNFARVKEYLALPDNPNNDLEDHYRHDEQFLDGTWEQEGHLHSAVRWKFRRIRRIQHPEPGAAYTYEEWKAGKTNGSAVGRSCHSTNCSHESYSINIEDQFRERGLQVIVKLANIEVSPRNPQYDGGNWHLEGMLNEHIVVTAIYYYDVENTTESRIRFRQEANIEYTEMDYEQDDHEPLSQIFGTESLRGEPAVQELGSISTPHGRLLGFPNTLQHKVEPFRLVDPTRPGHRRFLVLWLIDPHYRIASTANVPPQRYDWWEPYTLRRVMNRSGLPAELLDMVREDTFGAHMSMDEAKQVRLELMAERTNLMPTIKGNFQEYYFCEH